MRGDILALAQLATALATLFGVIFAGISSIRNGRRIREVHRQTDAMKQDLFTLTGRIYTGGRKQSDK